MQVAERTSDFAGVFRALADDINAALWGGPAAWASLIPSFDNHPMVRLVDLSNKWRPGKTPPVTIIVDRRPTGGGRFTVSRQGDLLVGFVRLESAASDAELQLDIGGQDFGGMTLLRSAGSFVFAHADRFIVPLINLRFHEVRVSTSTPDDMDMSVGIVWAFMDSLERREMCIRGAISYIDSAGAVAIYSSGMGGIGTVAVGTVADRSALVMLPDMLALTEIGSRDRTVARCDEIREELMAAAWHPRRVRAWCLEHDDEFADSGAAAVPDDRDVGGVRVLDGFLSPEECACMVSELGENPGPPALVPTPASTLALVVARLDAAMPLGSPWKVHGTRASYGDTSGGMHSHRDEAYQGGGRGAQTLLLYLTGPGDGGGSGGATVFAADKNQDQDASVQPMAGRAVVFAVRRMHRADPVQGVWRKIIAAFEIEGAVSK